MQERSSDISEHSTLKAINRMMKRTNYLIMSKFKGTFQMSLYRKSDLSFFIIRKFAKGSLGLGSFCFDMEVILALKIIKRPEIFNSAVTIKTHSAL